MFTGHPVHTHESGTTRRNKPGRSQRPRCVFQRNLIQDHKNPWTGLFYSLALTFGTLLSSQGTDASFVLTRETLSGFPPGASLRCFQPYQIRFPFRFRPGFEIRSPLEGVSRRGAAICYCRALRRDHYFSGFPRRRLIGAWGSNRTEFRHAEINPVQGPCSSGSRRAGVKCRPGFLADAVATRRTLHEVQRCSRPPLTSASCRPARPASPPRAGPVPRTPAGAASLRGPPGTLAGTRRGGRR